MEPLAALAPSMAEIDILMDMGLVQVDQPVAVALRAVQQGS